MPHHILLPRVRGKTAEAARKNAEKHLAPPRAWKDCLPARRSNTLLPCSPACVERLCEQLFRILKSCLLPRVRGKTEQCGRCCHIAKLSPPRAWNYLKTNPQLLRKANRQPRVLGITILQFRHNGG
ncbi:MAG: hypothetical protein M3405_17210 [Acidobacteriota bacterium]|nr:hypothetical protein [Acidobacteriota bacterium]